MLDVACLLSALCFLIANALRVVELGQRRSRGLNIDDLTELDVNYVEELWSDFGRDLPMRQTASILNIFAWFFFAIPVLECSWYLSKMGTRRAGVHGSIAIFTLVGAISEVLATLFFIGVNGTLNLVAVRFNKTIWLPNSISGGASDFLGWKTLELVFLTVESMLAWIDSFEWLCLALVMLLIHYSVAIQAVEDRQLSYALTCLGLVIAVLSMFDLAAGVLRFESWVFFSVISFIVAIVNTNIFLPAWLIWLGFQLPKMRPVYSPENDTFQASRG